MDARVMAIGSLNVDLVSRVPRFLLPGETLEGYDFKVYPGGKGGNQAVAASRLLPGGVSVLGKLGDDANGALYREIFRAENIDASCVETEPGLGTGTAVIEVDASSGDNRIVYIPGANRRVDRAQVDRHWERILAHRVFLLQLEIPLETVEHAVRRLHAAGRLVILDPAPAVPLPGGLLSQVDYLTPNEVELSLLTGLPTDTRDRLHAAALRLIDLGAPAVVVKAGRHGCFLARDGSVLQVPGFPVTPVDTTAAGDSFNAGLATALARGHRLEDALLRANAAGALSTLAPGAQGGMPTADEVEGFIREKGTGVS